ncbi:hypothetical protein ACQEWB_36740 [Streptomyces sp. CA-249302]|uniref:hypothetical protein n=1 Tax=Streptomyces sp. CA-249302 TaxID=3240058 RepID=UPI003D8BA423
MVAVPALALAPAADGMVGDTLTLTGTGVHNDSPSNGATVIDKAGQRFSVTVENTTAGPGFPGTVAISPGRTALGFITFAVANGSRVVTVQFAMDSGFSDDVGEWAVP